jgi:hypothetical protein
MKQDSIRLVAIELARIYAVYMAEFEKPKEKEQKQEQNDGNTPPDQPRFLPTSVTVHKKDLKSTSYNIRSLDQYLPMIFYGGGDDSDDEVRQLLRSHSGWYFTPKSHLDRAPIQFSLPSTFDRPSADTTELRPMMMATDSNPCSTRLS